jgi:hypothetical protein
MPKLVLLLEGLDKKKSLIRGLETSGRLNKLSYRITITVSGLKSASFSALPARTISGKRSIGGSASYPSIGSSD